MGLSYPVIRSQPLNFVLSSRLESINQKHGLGRVGGASLCDDKRRGLSATAVLQWRPESIRQLDLSLEGQVRGGLDILGASKAGAANLSRGDGDPTATEFPG